MSKKSLLYGILFLVLSAGNIYFACRCFISPQSEFQVEGDKNDFLCRWDSNAASVRIENGNIAGVGATAAESDFYWAVTKSYFMLNYNCAVIVDYNKDFIADYIRTADGKKYIQIKGELIQVSGFNFKKRIAILSDGKAMCWKDNHWNNYTTRPGEGFYSYQGYRDWWRIPLRFPYQITVIDTFDYGTLEKYDPSSLIADPKCETVVENISAIGYDGKFAVFQQRNVEKPYGCLIYASGSVRNFATTEELDRFIKLNYPGSALPEMMKLEKFYNLMWQAIEKIKRTDPQKLAY